MQTQTPLIVGNWKMNTDAKSAVELARAVRAGSVESAAGVDLLVCPPFPYLMSVRDALAGGRIELGAQDVWYEKPGACTGEVAVEMLVDIGCHSVILGHSERRHVIGETGELINRKIAASLAGSLEVILCVGELLGQREAGQTESVLADQLNDGLRDITASQMTNVLIAYEPVWAIGTGVTASPLQAESAHAHLRELLTDRYNSEVAQSTRILYGGSVKPDNAATLIQQPNVNGALVGGASLQAGQFLDIINVASEVTAG